MRGIICLVVLISAPFSIGISQIQSGAPERSNSGFPSLPENANPKPDGVRLLRDATEATNNLKMFRVLNLQRQKDMTEYTAKLLLLANELKAETAKSDPNSIPVVEARKVELIAKLAHAIHEKMRASIAN
ncbi:hypothetical protein [Acidicapsa ligni]|uniref:hypothetical protein n=1 Tax=Acidicapsa ligni TaxID=542300 RepID=UPI0021E0F9C2|nr:hypothetical protein [Acidicapsa ligni]